MAPDKHSKGGIGLVLSTDASMQRGKGFPDEKRNERRYRLLSTETGKNNAHFDPSMDSSHFCDNSGTAYSIVKGVYQLLTASM